MSGEEFERYKNFILEQQAQSVAVQATEQPQAESEALTTTDNRWKKVRGAASSSAGRAFGTIGSFASIGYTKAKGLLAREKGTSNNDEDG